MRGRAAAGFTDTDTDAHQQQLRIIEDRSAESGHEAPHKQ